MCDKIITFTTFLHIGGEDELVKQEVAACAHPGQEEHPPPIGKYYGEHESEYSVPV